MAGLRYNTGKLKWSLVSWKALAPMVRVLMFGAEKYDVQNLNEKFAHLTNNSIVKHS